MPVNAIEPHSYHASRRAHCSTRWKYESQKEAAEKRRRLALFGADFPRRILPRDLSARLRERRVD